MNRSILATAAFLVAAGASAQTTLTIASVNNPDMVTMQELSTAFEEQNPDIDLEWLFLDEGTLRSRLTTDVATGSGSFDVVTVGAYETPLWAANDWLVSMDALAEEYPEVAADYDFDDLLPAITAINTYEDELYALPFYGESSFTMYNKRLFDEAGLTMPEQPTWEQIREFACELHDPQNGVSGIVLRGKPGWGDNMAPITTVVNTFGGQWFDAEGMPQLDSPEWNEAVTFYRDLVNECGAPGVTGVSFPEALQLMSTGQAAMWVDATVAAGFLAGTDAGPDLAYALAPVGPVEKGNAWLWSWNLGIPSSSDAQEAAFKFTTWATSKEYIELVAEERGWAAVPPGTRTSTYENPAYTEAAPFAPLVLESINSANPTDATVAAGFLAGTDVGPDLSYALAPVGPVEKGNAWLWSWNLGIPSSSDVQEAAFKFATWATSKEYINLVAEERGWAAVPPGTRTSTYENPAYAEAAPFAPLVLESINSADPNDATAEPQIAPGVQFVQIPEFQGIGNDVAQIVSEILSGGTSVEDGLARAQQLADDAMFDAGYY